MDRWRIRRGVPNRLEHDGASLLVGINNVADGAARLSVLREGEPVGGFVLRVGSTCHIAGRDWTATAVEDGYVDLEPVL